MSFGFFSVFFYENKPNLYQWPVIKNKLLILWQLCYNVQQDNAGNPDMVQAAN